MDSECHSIMDTNCSKETGNKRKCRRSWTAKEKEVLIAALKDIIHAGWKVDNAFKIGYLTVLEQHLQKAFPGTDLHGLPHINSKIHSWKNDFSSLFSMVKKSGVGWNETTKMIEPTDEHWERVVLADANARTMRFKAWPYYNHWLEIFEKDRATGEGAEDFPDAVNRLMSEGYIPGVFAHPEKDVIYSTLNDEFDTQSSSHPSQSEKTTKSGKNKRKSMDAIDQIVDVLGMMVDKTDARLGEMVGEMGHEFRILSKRESVSTCVGEIEGLT